MCAILYGAVSAVSCCQTGGARQSRRLLDACPAELTCPSTVEGAPAPHRRIRNPPSSVRIDRGLLTQVEESRKSWLFLLLQTQNATNHTGDALPIFRLDSKLHSSPPGDRVKPGLTLV